MAPAKHRAGTIQDDRARRISQPFGLRVAVRAHDAGPVTVSGRLHCGRPDQILQRSIEMPKAKREAELLLDGRLGADNGAFDLLGERVQGSVLARQYLNKVRVFTDLSTAGERVTAQRQRLDVGALSRDTSVSTDKANIFFAALGYDPVEPPAADLVAVALAVSDWSVPGQGSETSQVLNRIALCALPG